MNDSAPTPASGTVGGPGGAQTTALPQGQQVPRCHTADLSMSLIPETDQRHHTHSRGQHGVTIALTNNTDHACSVKGYPGLAMLDSKAKTVSGPTRRGQTSWVSPDPGPRTIVLAPGKAAYAELEWTGPNDDVTPGNVRVSTLVVTPPDEYTHVTKPFAVHLANGTGITTTALTATLLPLAAASPGGVPQAEDPEPYETQNRRRP